MKHKVINRDAILCIMFEAERRGEKAPSHAVIGQRMGFGKSSITLAVGDLVDAGLLVIERRKTLTTEAGRAQVRQLMSTGDYERLLSYPARKSRMYNVRLGDAHFRIQIHDAPNHIHGRIAALLVRSGFGIGQVKPEGVE